MIINSACSFELNPHFGVGLGGLAGPQHVRLVLAERVATAATQPTELASELVAAHVVDEEVDGEAEEIEQLEELVQFPLDARHAVRRVEQVAHGELRAQHVTRQAEQDDDAGEREEHARLAQLAALAQRALAAGERRHRRHPVEAVAGRVVAAARRFRRRELDAHVARRRNDRGGDRARPGVVDDEGVVDGRVVRADDRHRVAEVSRHG